MICVKNDRWFVLKWQIYIISVSHQNQNNGLPCCSTPRRISFLCFVLIQTSLHEGDAWYHFVVIFTCLLLTLYFICNSMAINLIWIELDWIEKPEFWHISAFFGVKSISDIPVNQVSASHSEHFLKKKWHKTPKNPILPYIWLSKINFKKSKLRNQSFNSTVFWQCWCAYMSQISERSDKSSGGLFDWKQVDGPTVLHQISLSVFLPYQWDIKSQLHSHLPPPA